MTRVQRTRGILVIGEDFLSGPSVGSRSADVGHDFVRAPQGLRKATFAGRRLLFNKGFSSFATEEKHFERPLNLVDAQAVGDDLAEVGAVLLQPL